MMVDSGALVGGRIEKRFNFLLSFGFSLQLSALCFISKMLVFPFDLGLPRYN